MTLTHFDRDLRPGFQFVVFAFQEMIEEGLQLAHVFRDIVVGPLLAAMDFEPFLFRRDVPESFHGAARMQALIGPACDHESRRGDLGEVYRL